MLYRNDSEDAIRACEEARTGFYGYDEGGSSVGESHIVNLDFLVSAIREADEKKQREYWYKKWGVK